MPHTDWMQSPAPASRNFFRRLLMCCLRELSVQSGVSWLIESKITDFATAFPGFISRSFNSAYYVLVTWIGSPATVTPQLF